jgi:hypothetical protein
MASRKKGKMTKHSSGATGEWLIKKFKVKKGKVLPVHDMNCTERMEVKLQSFLASAVDRGKWPASRYYIYIYIYVITAIGLTPGGSSTSYIYTQTIHTIQRKENLGSAGRASSLRVIPWHFPYN